MQSFRSLPSFGRSLLPLLVLAVASQSVSAQNVWDGGGGDGNWTTGANWDNDLPPTFPQAIAFDGGLNLSTFNDFVGATVNGITFNLGAGAFTLNGNAITLAGNIVDNSANLQTINLGVSFGASTVFETGAGGMTFGGAIINTAASLRQDLTVTNTGTVTLSGPITSTSGGTLRLLLNGTSDSSTLSILGNNVSTLNAGQIQVTRGTINFGNGSDAPSLEIGSYGAGTGEWLQIGNTAGAISTFNMNSGTLHMHGTGAESGRRFVIANAGTGIWNQTGGTVTLTFDQVGTYGVFNANQNGMVGTMNISGGVFDAVGASPNFLTPFNVETRGTGTLNVSGTGLVKAGRLYLNSGRGNNVASGTVNLMAGGTLEVGSILRNGTVANNGTAIFNFDGGTLRALQTTTGFWNNNAGTTANVQDGGAIIDTASFDITIAQALVHDAALGAVQDGGLDKKGLGVLTLSGVNTFTGVTRVRAGGLTIAASGALANTASLTVDPGAALTLQSATALNDALILYLVDGNILDLAFTGEDIIGKLFLNNVELANGVYGATEIAALAPGITTSGGGYLVVPEPSTAALCGFGVLALLGWRRTRR